MPRTYRGFPTLRQFPTLRAVVQDQALRRLFTTFARGWPGAGLLLLRLVASMALVRHGRGYEPKLLQLVDVGTGILLLAGLWTPVAGALLTIVGLWEAFFGSGDPLIHVVLAGLGVVLMLVGPGAWSIDARLFGRKRIKITDDVG